MELLVINLARMGDILQTIPMVKGFKQQNPDSRISLLVNKNFNDLKNILPYIDNTFTIDFNHIRQCLSDTDESVNAAYAYLNSIFKSLSEHHFDQIVNMVYLL